jgi:hypothetical protein
VGQKQPNANDAKYVFTLSSNEDPIFNRILPLSRNLAKLNKRVLETPTEFAAVTNLSCHQAASPVRHELILSVIQIGVSIQISDNTVLIDVTGLPDPMTEK